MIASQEYRNGAAAGASHLAARIVKIQQYGIPVDYSNIGKMVAAIAEEWGSVGYTEIEDE